ncbi:MAG: hypothetical protein UX89_C0020G0012 [Parcubacteria group bacterium GW2011_GWA2_47_16]|nr:MAG: hypothetical protein UX89_C0020G0012 [Parcubacteria group bacterium GW2011_GWA2_47_16]
MRNRIKSLVTAQNRKHKRILLTDASLEAIGALQYKINVPLQDGPCFQHARQTFAWQKGWRQAFAYQEGREARLRGGIENDNPYGYCLYNTPTNMGLAEEWRKGFHEASVPHNRLIV